ncbi:hypothetical protein HK098_001744 [Nowakowskiella sp. JEL0407]|nr:hypothetical protein HK098_001744 [Nowakowskiella sp. JEL0407]
MEKGGKKGGRKKSGGNSNPGPEKSGSEDKHAQDEITIEIYECKIQDLTEKWMKCKDKYEILLYENEMLKKSQAKFTHDKHDLETTTSLLQSELDSLHTLCAKYKSELEQLSEFKSQKKDLELQLLKNKQLLEQKEKEFKDTVHLMERKILQDKNLMKKEMVGKINEAVANFRRVADQQMAETTKRAIRENQAISTQLKKMSAKTIELISENESLSTKLSKLKLVNLGLEEESKELVKKNLRGQRVLRMLVEKLKESDKMLELAYEINAAESECNRDSEKSSSENQQLEKQVPQVPLESEDTEKEYRELESNKMELALKVAEFIEILEEFDMTTNPQLENIKYLSERVKYIKDSLVNSYLVKLPRNSDAKYLSTSQSSTPFPKSASFINQQTNTQPPLPHPTSTPPNPTNPTKNQNNESNQNNQPIPYHPVEISKFHGANVDLNPIFRAKTPSEIPNFELNQKTITALREFEKSRENESVPKLQSVGVQTSGVFGISTEVLLSEVRPWGKSARCLPKKGLGLYVPQIPAINKSRS